MQPSLVMSALAIGLFSQSSEAERGAAGRVKALKLIELAHSSLQASMASGRVDVELIQAAWVSTPNIRGKSLVGSRWPAAYGVLRAPITSEEVR